MKKNEIDRQKIESDVEAYLSRGGTITELPNNFSGETLRVEKADSTRLRWTKDSNQKRDISVAPKRNLPW